MQEQDYGPLLLCHVKHWYVPCMLAARGSQEHISCTMWCMHAGHMTASVRMTCVLVESYMFLHVC